MRDGQLMINMSARNLDDTGVVKWCSLSDPTSANHLCMGQLQADPQPKVQSAGTMVKFVGPPPSDFVVWAMPKNEPSLTVFCFFVFFAYPRCGPILGNGIGGFLVSPFEQRPLSWTLCAPVLQSGYTKTSFSGYPTRKSK